MTTTLQKSASSTSQLWSSMPGWGIVVNLLPPEVLAARRIRVIRKLIVSAVGVIVFIAALAYGYAYWQVHTASNQLAAAETQTAQLHRSQLKYTPVVALQAQTSHIKDELAGATATNVDLPILVGKLVALSPDPNQLAKVDVEVTAAAPASSAVSSTSGTGSLDTSGRLHIGTVTITGAATSMGQVSRYVHRLDQVPGVVEVFPLSAQADSRLLDFTIEMTMTDQLLTGGSAAPSGVSTVGGN
jgi:hypothetical protein